MLTHQNATQLALHRMNWKLTNLQIFNGSFWEHSISYEGAVELIRQYQIVDNEISVLLDYTAMLLIHIIQ